MHTNGDVAHKWRYLSVTLWLLVTIRQRFIYLFIYFHFQTPLPPAFSSSHCSLKWQLPQPVPGYTFCLLAFNREAVTASTK